MAIRIENKCMFMGISVCAVPSMLHSWSEASALALGNRDSKHFVTISSQAESLEPIDVCVFINDCVCMYMSLMWSRYWFDAIDFEQKP